MGIPNLLSTLEPFAQSAHLDNRHVAIDGPALAYHILHKCTANGFLEPSYGLLGRSAIAWLDTLASHGIVVEAIYFDGYLPPFKRPVRFDRVQKSTAHLIRLSSKCPYGLPPPRPSASTLDASALFDISGQPHEQKHFPLQPPFLVPAVVDALRASDRYKGLIHLVNGEADDFCAMHVFKGTPACILTSDSDLLVHDLANDTSVAFLRDIYMASDNSLSCSLFSPSDIAAQFEVSCTRLAYERARLPHATLNQLRRVCLEESPDESLYRVFCRQYTKSEKGLSRTAWDFSLLDPRLSELVYQLSDPASLEPDMFLPTLTENPSRRSAWEPSLSLRQMAYSFAMQACKNRHKLLLEHRKIQNTSQHKGTRVKLSKRTARLLLDELQLLLRRCARVNRDDQEPSWVLVCLAVDVQDHLKSEKRSFLLDMLQQPPSWSRGSKVHSWELVHATAHFLATLYSFRLVDQVIGALPREAINELPAGLTELVEQIARLLPPLTEFPDVAVISQFLQDRDRASSLGARLREVVDIPDDETDGENAGNDAASPRNDHVQKVHHSRPKSNNPFDLLSADE